jgi:hypothetical protein
VNEFRGFSRNLVNGGRVVTVANEEVRLDLSQASLRFPDGRDGGDLHTQFLTFDQLSVTALPGVLPLYLYANQPRGIEVSGTVSLTLIAPSLRDSYTYLDGIPYVVLLGYDPEREVLVPVGVGQVDNHLISSQGKISLPSLDFLGFAVVNPALTPLLESVAKGDASLQQLNAALVQ